MSDSVFRALSLDKWEWSPSPLPGQVVLVTSRDEHGVVDVAPKSWVTMAAGSGPTVGFGCTREHRTARNVEVTREFVINVPGFDLAEMAWAMPDAPDRLAGLTTLPGVTVDVPVLRECPAHLECALDRIVEFSHGEVFIFGTVRRVGADQRCLGPDAVGERYDRLGHPFFFLESGWLAPLGQATPVLDRPAG
jgi:flavin reductase (DIM6/NTAB) family NADH-FMN oxidoreductase RutF